LQPHKGGKEAVNGKGGENVGKVAVGA